MEFFAFEWITDPEIWASLVTLMALEIVLGIDNLLFISILAGRLPAHQQPKARKVGLALALITRQADLLFVLLSWVFVALRVFHAYIMVTTNYVPRRARVHFAALAILVLMWAIFALHILLAI